jgi:hypothetical protein
MDCEHDPFDYLYKASCSGQFASPSEHRVFYRLLYELLSSDWMPHRDGWAKEFSEAYQ